MNKERMFKQRHSFPMNTISSQVSMNPHKILSKENEVENEINKEKEIPDRRKTKKKEIMSVKNKYHVNNASSENIEKVLKSYCEDCDYKKKVFVRLISNAD